MISYIGLSVKSGNVNYAYSLKAYTTYISKSFKYFVILFMKNIKKIYRVILITTRFFSELLSF